MTVEPYSHSSSSSDQPRGNDKGAVGPNAAEVETGAMKPTGKPYDQMMVDEKIKICCRAFNSAKGCGQTAARCRFKHWCAVVEDVREGTRAYIVNITALGLEAAALTNNRTKQHLLVNWLYFFARF